MATKVRGDEVIAARGAEYLAAGETPYYGRLVDVAKGLAFDPVFVPGVLGETGWEMLEDGVEEAKWEALTESVVDVPAPPEIADAYEELAEAWQRAEAATGGFKDYRVLSDTKGLVIVGRPEATGAFEVKAGEDDDVVELELTEEEFWANQNWLQEVRRLREQGGKLEETLDPDEAAIQAAARANAAAAGRAERSLRAAAGKGVELRYGVKVSEDQEGNDA